MPAIRMGNGVINLGDSMDIRGVEELHREFLNDASGAQPLLLCASAVERIDTAALQLLAAACRGRSVTWDAPSAQLLEAARLLDLTDALALGNR